MHKTISVPFSKIDPDQRMIYGYASTADRDSDGEIITLDALKNALPGYMRFATIREMHDAKPIGKTKEASVDGNGLYIGAKIVDADAWKLVKEEVYSAFSVGGKVLERDEADPSVIKGMSLLEISLVDVPANPNCTIDLIKVADMGEDEVEKKARCEDQSDDDAEDDEVDPDHDGDNDLSDSEDDPDGDKEKSARIQAEDEALYKNLIARFGQEKADQVMGKSSPTIEAVLEKIEATIDQLDSAIDKAIETEVSEPEVDTDFLASVLIADLFKGYDIDQITALQSTAKKAEVRELLEGVKAAKDIAVKGAAKDHSATVQAIHDHSSHMGAKCMEKTAIKSGDLSKAFEKVTKLTGQLNDANAVIDKLNKQIADKEDYIEQLKKTPRAPMPITTPAELPEGMIAVAKGATPKEEELQLSDEQRVMKGWREARESAFRK